MKKKNMVNKVGI